MIGRLVTLAAALGAATMADATPVQWVSGPGANGHYYEYVAFAGGSGRWDDALPRATASSFDGMSGYLATVTSAQENQFLSSLSTSVAYLGGSDPTNTGVWGWVDGPEAGSVFFSGGSVPAGAYASWGAHKPDNFGGGEDWLHTNFGSVGAWNDTWLGGTSGSIPTAGYFVEYSAAVPEPASWAMMGIGLVALGTSARRRTRVAATRA